MALYFCECLWSPASFCFSSPISAWLKCPPKYLMKFSLIFSLIHPSNPSSSMPWPHPRHIKSYCGGRGARVGYFKCSADDSNMQSVRTSMDLNFKCLPFNMSWHSATQQDAFILHNDKVCKDFFTKLNNYAHIEYNLPSDFYRKVQLKGKRMPLQMLRWHSHWTTGSQKAP